MCLDNPISLDPEKQPVLGPNYLDILTAKAIRGQINIEVEDAISGEAQLLIALKAWEEYHRPPLLTTPKSKSTCASAFVRQGKDRGALVLQE